MKLADYLAREGISPADFAKRVGINRQHAWHLAKGTRTPSGKLAAAIERETGAAVTSADFYPPASDARAA